MVVKLVVREHMASSRADTVKHLSLTRRGTATNVEAAGASRRTALKELTKSKAVKLTMRRR